MTLQLMGDVLGWATVICVVGLCISLLAFIAIPISGLLRRNDSARVGKVQEEEVEALRAYLTEKSKTIPDGADVYFWISHQIEDYKVLRRGGK